MYDREIESKLLLYAADAVIEAGHYYKNVGQTLLGAAGWTCMQGIIKPGNKKILFIDDVHQDNTFEDSAVIKDWKPVPAADEVIFESATVKLAKTLISQAAAAGLTKTYKGKKMLRVDPWFPIEIDSSPTCVAMDAALSLLKWQKYVYFVNILPSAYKGQQEQLGQFLGAMQPHLNLGNKSFDSYYFM